MFCYCCMKETDDFKIKNNKKTRIYCFQCYADYTSGERKIKVQKNVFSIIKGIL